MCQLEPFNTCAAVTKCYKPSNEKICLLTAGMGKTQISVFIPDINQQYWTHDAKTNVWFHNRPIQKDTVTTDPITLNLVTKLEA